ncbi:hypothetical protein [Clostridium akagii]|uniref:hypothetical protein n=1 Tax=Clostridium akagii TaxID=91623 RepID=UPI000479D7B5|nr:hypothetical protein [Clostridium akagii]
MYEMNIIVNSIFLLIVIGCIYETFISKDIKDFLRYGSIAIIGYILTNITLDLKSSLKYGVISILSFILVYITLDILRKRNYL